MCGRQYSKRYLGETLKEITSNARKQIVIKDILVWGNALDQQYASSKPRTSLSKPTGGSQSVPRDMSVLGLKFPRVLVLAPQ